MYRLVVKKVVENLKKTTDLSEVKSILNEHCSYSDFVNIVNELLNQLSEEHATAMNMIHKNRILKNEIKQKDIVIDKIKKTIAEENIEVIYEESMIISKTRFDKMVNNNYQMFDSNKKLSKELTRVSKENGKLEAKLEEKNEQIINLSEKYKKANTAIGGYTKGNNKYLNQIEKLKQDVKDLSLIISKQQEEIDELGINNIELKDLNESFKIENAKMKGIIDNLNKLVSKKMEPKPTVEKIVNYDRKQPSK